MELALCPWSLHMPGATGMLLSLQEVGGGPSVWRSDAQETPGEEPHLQTAGARRAYGVECRTGGRQIQWLDATEDCFHSQSTPVGKYHMFRKGLNSFLELCLLHKLIAMGSMEGND